MFTFFFTLLIYNARRGTAGVAEKDFDVIILMTLERVLVQDSRKKNCAKKM